MNAVEMGNKLGVDGGISKVAFHHAEFALGVTFLPVKLNLLAFYHLEFALIRLIPIDVSDNTRVLEIYDGIVDEKSRGGRGMENVEVVIFDPRTIEVGRRVCLHVKRNGVLRAPLLVNPYNVSINPNLPKSDISHYFVLTILIEEDEGVLPHITVVILTPSISWVVWIVKLLGELRNVGDGARCGG